MMSVVQCFWHIAHDCTRPRHVGPRSSGIARASDRSDGTTDLGGSLDHGRSTTEATIPATGSRRRRSRSKLPRRMGDCASGGRALVRSVGPADRGGSHGLGRAMTGTTATASDGWRRRRRRKHRRRRGRLARSVTAPASTSVASDALLVGAAHAPLGTTVGRPRNASPSTTRFWRRCARTMVPLLWSFPSTRC
jgi:hypothetical protein